MTQEEKAKAKAYDRALEIAKAWCKLDNNDLSNDDLKTLFPELKESEDEKIIKALKEGFKYHQLFNPTFGGIPCVEIVNWLEKQNSNVDNANKEYWRGYREGKQEILDKYAELEKQSESDETKAKMFLINKGYPIDTNGTFPTYEEIYNIIREGLEKQGKEKPRYSIGDVLCDKSCATLSKDAQPNFEITDIRNGMYICDKGSFPISQQDEYELVAKKIEQKSADKSKPKFKVGDWIIFNGLTLYVKEVVKGYYRTISIGGIHNSYDWDIDNIARLWTIQDAKEGNVLVCPFPKGYEAGGQIFIFKEINSRDYVDNCIEYYCRICEGVFYENKNGYMGTTSSPLYPATKEQRDLLFSKMKEAGYVWDADKKELKKIDNEEVNGEDYGIDGLWHAQRILEKTLGCVDGYQTDDGILDHKAAITAVKKLYKQKPTEWSEEDETELTNTIIMLKEGASLHFNKKDITKAVDWLKSLKDRVQPQNTWKPSDAQMEVLVWCMPLFVDPKSKGILESLINELKKLKGE